MRRWALLFVILVGAYPAAALADPPVLAVLDLDNRTGDPAYDAAGPGVAQVLVSKFARVDTVKVVERVKLSAVLGELALQRGSAIDDKTAVKAGKLLGARYLVMGQLFSVKLPSVSVNLRIVDVSTGQVVVAKDVTGEVGGDGSEFFVLIDTVAFEVLDALQLKLGASDRIEFGQIDVHRLDTLEAYGSALKAIDAGKNDEAQRLLGQAIALEPGFHLAQDELDKIAASIAAKRTIYANDAITHAHQHWDALRTEADPIAKDPPATLTGAAWMAIRGRLYLVDGQIPEALAFEQKRAQWTRDHWTAISAEHRYVTSDFETEVRDLLRARDMQSHGETVFGGLQVFPAAIRADCAPLLVILGHKDEAAALLVTSYQDPGPLEYENSKPPDPLRKTDDLGLWDLEVVLRRQHVRALELAGDVNGAHQALNDLDRAVQKATEQRDERKKYELVQAAVARQPADHSLLGDEERAVRAARSDPSIALAGYQAFLARVHAGYYKSVQSDSEFVELADNWHNAVTSVLWDENWAADQKVAALLAYNEERPTTDPAALAKRKTDLDTAISGWYPK